jgi:hypothetical protein
MLHLGRDKICVSDYDFTCTKHKTQVVRVVTSCCVAGVYVTNDSEKLGLEASICIHRKFC